MSKFCLGCVIVCFIHCVESNAESVNDQGHSNLNFLKCIFLVLYSKVAMETGKEAKLLVDSGYALSSVLLL